MCCVKCVPLELIFLFEKNNEYCSFYLLLLLKETSITLIFHIMTRNELNVEVLSSNLENLKIY